MKIRTITTGFNLEVPLNKGQITRIASLTKKLKNVFENEGYTVQTVRISTQPWEQYFQSKEQIINLVGELEVFTKDLNIDYFSVGMTKNPKIIPMTYDMISNTSKMFCSAQVCDDKKINYEAARATAEVIKKNSNISSNGFDNLRFAALFNTKSSSPFYPASYHEGPISFAVGTENSDLVYKAFSKAKSMERAGMFLQDTLMEEFTKIENIGKNFSRNEKVKYNGIDVSIATSVNPDESIAYAFEKLGIGRFGEAGTLAVSRLITETLERLNLKKCGYSGLMLPVLEDYGLSKRNIEGSYNITNLLLYSTVCGTGIDTAPLPGNVTEEKIFALLLDVATLSIKLDKPLSARLMPVPNKNVGDMTNFGFEYFTNTKIMEI